MPYDDLAVILDPPARRGDSLFLTWTAPADATVQVYLDGRLAWSGTGDSCSLPWPLGRVRIDAGTVGPGEGSTDFGDSLPSRPADRASLAWRGGSYLAPGTLARFDIFASPIPGSPVSYAAPVATVAAYDAGIVTDGFGMGGFGSGGFGESAADYAWTSGPLAPGEHAFAVEAVDDAGTASTAAVASVAITGPPRPPGRNPAGLRLDYAIDVAGVPTLIWLPSPR